MPILTPNVALNEPFYLVVPFLSGSGNQKTSGRVFSRIPASQFINLIVLLTSIVLLRNDAFLRLLEPTVSALLRGNRSEDYLVKKVLQPLSPLNWFVHSLPLPINLIILSALSHRMTRPEAVDVGITFRPSSRRVAQALFAFHLLGHVQGFVALLNHCIIDVNNDANLALLFIFSALIRTQVFGLGLSLLIGWGAFLPVFALVATDLLTFQSPAGGILSLVSLVGIMACRHRDVGPAYKAAWVMFAIEPAITDTSTDFGHMMATAFIAVLLAVMAFSLTRRLQKTQEIH